MDTLIVKEAVMDAESVVSTIINNNKEINRYVKDQITNTYENIPTI